MCISRKKAKMCCFASKIHDFNLSALLFYDLFSPFLLLNFSQFFQKPINCLCFFLTKLSSNEAYNRNYWKKYWYSWNKIIFLQQIFYFSFSLCKRGKKMKGNALKNFPFPYKLFSKELYFIRQYKWRLLCEYADIKVVLIHFKLQTLSIAILCRVSLSSLKTRLLSTLLAMGRKTLSSAVLFSMSSSLTFHPIFSFFFFFLICFVCINQTLKIIKRIFLIFFLSTKKKA